MTASCRSAPRVGAAGQIANDDARAAAAHERIAVARALFQALGYSQEAIPSVDLLV